MFPQFPNTEGEGEKKNPKTKRKWFFLGWGGGVKFIVVYVKELKKRSNLYFFPLLKNRSHCLKIQMFQDKESDATTNDEKKN